MVGYTVRFMTEGQRHQGDSHVSYHEGKFAILWKRTFNGAVFFSLSQVGGMNIA
jgi:hypothetical protein